MFLWRRRLSLSRHDRHAVESLRTILGGAVLIFIGLPMVISTYLSVTLIGVVIFTCGLVIVHSVAFGWVGALAHADRAEASIMYVACCYLRRIRIGPRISSLRVVLPDAVDGGNIPIFDNLGCYRRWAVGNHCVGSHSALTCRIHR